VIPATTGRGNGELRWVEKDDRLHHDSYFYHSGRRCFGGLRVGRSDGRGCRGGPGASASAGVSGPELSGMTG
jgi:hypothetical protein